MRVSLRSGNVYPQVAGPTAARTAMAQALAAAGLVLDNEIDVGLADAFGTMAYRFEAGYAWVPAFGSGLQVTPAQTQSTVAAGDPSR